MSKSDKGKDYLLVITFDQYYISGLIINARLYNQIPGIVERKFRSKGIIIHSITLIS